MAGGGVLPLPQFQPGHADVVQSQILYPQVQHSSFFGQVLPSLVSGAQAIKGMVTENPEVTLQKQQLQSKQQAMDISTLQGLTTEGERKAYITSQLAAEQAKDHPDQSRIKGLQGFATGNFSQAVQYQHGQADQLEKLKNGAPQSQLPTNTQASPQAPDQGQQLSPDVTQPGTQVPASDFAAPDAPAVTPQAGQDAYHAARATDPLINAAEARGAAAGDLAAKGLGMAQPPNPYVTSTVQNGPALTGQGFTAGKGPSSGLFPLPTPASGANPAFLQLGQKLGSDSADADAGIRGRNYAYQLGAAALAAGKPVPPEVQLMYEMTNAQMKDVLLQKQADLGVKSPLLEPENLAALTNLLYFNKDPGAWKGKEDYLEHLKQVYHDAPASAQVMAHEYAAKIGTSASNAARIAAEATLATQRFTHERAMEDIGNRRAKVAEDRQTTYDDAQLALEKYRQAQVKDISEGGASYQRKMAQAGLDTAKTGNAAAYGALARARADAATAHMNDAEISNLAKRRGVTYSGASGGDSQLKVQLGQLSANRAIMDSTRKEISDLSRHSSALAANGGDHTAVDQQIQAKQADLATATENVAKAGAAIGQGSAGNPQRFYNSFWLRHTADNANKVNGHHQPPSHQFEQALGGISQGKLPPAPDEATFYKTLLSGPYRGQPPSQAQKQEFRELWDAQQARGQ